MILRRITQWFIVLLTMFLWGIAAGLFVVRGDGAESFFFAGMAVASTIATAIIFRS